MAPPAAVPERPTVERQLDQSNEYGYFYYSFHDGGAAFGFADGSVRFLARTFDMQTLRAMITRGGGEVVNLP